MAERRAGRTIASRLQHRFKFSQSAMIESFIVTVHHAEYITAE
jgi:hypothetical protein